MLNHKSNQEPAESKTFDAELTEALVEVDQARLLRKIDLHVLPFICVMYLLAFLDRYVQAWMSRYTHIYLSC
jgi:hypothetical protein